MGRLDGKVTVITGGGTGIGKAIAVTMAAENARLVIACRRPDVGESAAEELRKSGADCIYVPVDISVPEQGRSLIRRTIEHYGRIDILVNNAGISTSFIPFMEMKEEQFDLVVDTNLRGTFFLSQAAAVEMAKGTGGKIVHITTNITEIAQKGCAHYMSAKGGLRSLTRNMALELAPYGIQVNAVAPGEIFVEAAREYFEDTTNAAKFAAIPAGRVGEAEDVAEAVVFLASGASDYITGQTIFIDGGQMIG